MIVSDGGDNASRTSFEQTLKSALTSNTVIYTVGLIDEVQGDADPKRLKQLADSTGGEAFRPRDIRQVSTLLPRIAVRIRQSYTHRICARQPRSAGDISTHPRFRKGTNG